MCSFNTFQGTQRPTQGIRILAFKLMVTCTTCTLIQIFWQGLTRAGNSCFLIRYVYMKVWQHKSVFGWVLSGSCSPKGMCTQLLCAKVSESSLSKFWDLKLIGVTCKEDLIKDSNSVQQKFNERVIFADESYGSYGVALPGKSDTARFQLLDNVKIA